MKLKFLGATQTVTGSKYLLKGKKHHILIDCGLYQGIDSNELNRNIVKQLKNDRIDCVILTHAHLDHCGYLPKLVKDGFHGPIFSTHATKDLSKIILEDNASIQKNEKVEHPLYEKIHVSQTMSLFKTKDFNHDFNFKEFEITFNKAGHILGASTVVIKEGTKVVQFSGDLGRIEDLTMYPPQDPFHSCNALIVESTYGDRLHSNEDYLKVIKSIVQRNKELKATLVIPAFSVGRSQTMMLVLGELFDKYPELTTKVYIDSPMTQKVTRLYHYYPELHKISIEKLKGFETQFRFVQFQSEKEKIDLPGNKIILTAAGMLSGGNVLRHLENHGADSNNTFLITGFQSPGTNGYKLINNERELFINNKFVKINAKVETLYRFSSHPDQDQLLAWCKKIYTPNIYLVHGEKSSKEIFKNKLQERLTAKVTIVQTQQLIDI